MAIAFRILSLLFYLLVLLVGVSSAGARPTSAAHALLRSEDRVGGSLVFSRAPASTNPARALEKHQVSTGSGYDSASDRCTYRLTNEVITAGVSPTGSVSYTYDLVGNRTSRAATSDLTSLLGSSTPNFDVNDHLGNDATPSTTSTNYRAAGSLVYYGTTNYVYDWAEADRSSYQNDSHCPCRPRMDRHEEVGLK